MKWKRTSEETRAKVVYTEQDMINHCSFMAKTCNEIIRKEIKRIYKLDEISNEDLNIIKYLKKSALNTLEELCWEETRQIKPRLRFKILKRDTFTCQYCWRSAPDVILHIDHIIPYSKWGLTKENNLKTSCQDCNLWKSNIH